MVYNLWRDPKRPAWSAADAMPRWGAVEEEEPVAIENLAEVLTLSLGGEDRRGDRE